MNVLQLHSRRLLQAASSPNSDNDGGINDNNLDINTHFSPSMAVILVVLLTAFFFMGVFSIYVKRCSSRQEEDTRTRTVAPQSALENQSQGVDATFLETLPLVTYCSSKKKGSNVECVVCLTDFNEGEPLCQLPRCKHVFHKECIDMWLFSHTTCPLCRRSVLSDGSRSFRWGGSGSLRLSLGRRGSGRESGRGSIAGPAAAREEGSHGSLSQRNANLEGIASSRAGSLRRSHSTGHSLVKQAQSRERMVGNSTPTYSDTENVQSKAGCLPLTPSAAYARSRSMVAIGGDATATAAPGSISAWMREAGASLKRALSVKKVSPAAGDFGTPVAPAASSSARSIFDPV